MTINQSVISPFDKLRVTIRNFYRASQMIIIFAAGEVICELYILTVKSLLKLTHCCKGLFFVLSLLSVIYEKAFQV